MASDKVLHISDSEFENKIVDELAEEFEGKVVIAKMNVDDNPATPGKFGIRAIPTLILFKGGEVVDQITGAVGKTQLQDLIKKVI
jgi:thioredoxin 1